MPAAVGLVVLLAAGLLLITRGPDSTTLRVIEGRTDQVVFERDVDVGEEFRLAHRHSVTRRMVYETFSVLDERTVAMEELWFDAFGANLPAGPEEVDGQRTEFIAEDGAYRVVHDGRPLGVLTVRAGSEEVDHVITFADGQQLRLLDAVPPGGRVDVVVGDDPDPSAR